MNIYLLLFLEFFKTGLFSIGGGLATIPFLKELGETYGWYSTKELTEMIAVAESTPGPMGINMATYSGFKTAGILGSALSTLSLVLPSVIIMCIVAKWLMKARNNFWVESVFYGLRASTIGLIGGAVSTIFILSIFTGGIISLQTVNVTALIMYVVMTLFVFVFKKINPIFVVMIGAAAGIILGL